MNQSHYDEPSSNNYINNSKLNMSLKKTHFSEDSYMLWSLKIQIIFKVNVDSLFSVIYWVALYYLTAYGLQNVNNLQNLKKIN